MTTDKNKIWNLYEHSILEAIRPIDNATEAQKNMTPDERKAAAEQGIQSLRAGRGSDLTRMAVNAGVLPQGSEYTPAAKPAAPASITGQENLDRAKAKAQDDAAITDAVASGKRGGITMDKPSPTPAANQFRDASGRVNTAAVARYQGRTPAAPAANTNVQRLSPGEQTVPFARLYKNPKMTLPSVQPATPAAPAAPTAAPAVPTAAAPTAAAPTAAPAVPTAAAPTAAAPTAAPKAVAPTAAPAAPKAAAPKAAAPDTSSGLSPARYNPVQSQPAQQAAKPSGGFLSKLSGLKFKSNPNREKAYTGSQSNLGSYEAPKKASYKPLFSKGGIFNK